MKRLSEARIQPAHPWQKERLDRWLAEWSIDRDLAEEPHELRTVHPVGGRPVWEMISRQEAPVAAQRTTSQGASPKPATGQIRLLLPVNAAAAARLWYVALIEPVEPGFRIAPFGRFSEPALPAEWATGRPQLNLRVLCLWNDGILSRKALEESWFVDRFSEIELADAVAVSRYHRGEEALPSHLERRVGPPLIHPLDPRWNYREQERAALGELVGDAPVTSYTGGTSAELALAAEPGGVYGTRFRVGELPLTLAAAPGPAPTSRTVLVLGPENRASHALDGGVLRAPDGTTSPPVADGQVVVPERFLDVCLIVCMPDGRQLPLRAAN